jgi:hypothetical protein
LRLSVLSHPAHLSTVSAFCTLVFTSVEKILLLVHLWRNKIVFCALFGICFFEFEASVCGRKSCDLFFYNHVSRIITADIFQSATPNSSACSLLCPKIHIIKDCYACISKCMIWYYMIRYDIWHVMIYDTIWHDMIWYDIFVNCVWVDTRWQQYSTVTHKQYTEQHNETMYRKEHT